jgi:prevent-host-death family protein
MGPTGKRDMTTEPSFEEVSIRGARNRLSSLVSAAKAGRPTIITRHGRPAAMIIPINDARRLCPRKVPQDPQAEPNFAELLLSIPVPFVVRRSRSGTRSAEFLIKDQERSDS